MTIGFARTLTWFGVVGLCAESCDDGFCFVFDIAQHWYGWRVAMSVSTSSLTLRCFDPCMKSCDVGCCLSDVWSVTGSCDVGCCFVFGMVQYR